jgi:hypothetical protein
MKDLKPVDISGEKERINYFAMNCKNKNTRDLHRGINGFNRDYQPRKNVLKVENDDMLADSQHFE